MKKHYITAVTKLLLQGKDADVVFSNLKKVLTAKGHLTIHSQILSGVLQSLERQVVSEGSTIIVAKDADVATLTVAIVKSLEKIGGDAKTAKIVTDATLIGGYVTLHKGLAIDASYKQKLVSLYRSITK